MYNMYSSFTIETINCYYRTVLTRNTIVRVMSILHYILVNIEDSVEVPLG